MTGSSTAWPSPASNVTLCLHRRRPGVGQDERSGAVPRAPSAGTPGQNHVLVSAASDGTDGIHGAGIDGEHGGSGAGVSRAGDDERACGDDGDPEDWEPAEDHRSASSLASSSSTQENDVMRSASRSISVSSPAICRRNRAGTVARLAASEHEHPQQRRRRRSRWSGPAAARTAATPTRRRRRRTRSRRRTRPGRRRPRRRPEAASVRRRACRGGRPRPGRRRRPHESASAPRSVAVAAEVSTATRLSRLVGRRRLRQRAFEQPPSSGSRRGSRRARSRRAVIGGRTRSSWARERGEQARRDRQRVGGGRGGAVDQRDDDVAHAERSEQATAAKGGRITRSRRSLPAARSSAAWSGTGQRSRKSAPPSSTRAIATPSPMSSDGNGISRGSPR